MLVHEEAELQEKLQQKQMFKQLSLPSDTCFLVFVWRVSPVLLQANFYSLFSFQNQRFLEGNFQFWWASVSDPLLMTGGELGDMEGHARLGGGGSGGGGG